MSHVANRDILISSIAAAIGMSITFLARFAFFFGGSDDEGGGNIIGLLMAWILAPIAAMLIQMAVTRSREYQADESGAFLSRDPDALASALLKLEQASHKVPPLATVSPAEAHMFIVNPMNALQARGRGGSRVCSGPTRRPRLASSAFGRSPASSAESAARSARSDRRPGYAVRSWQNSPNAST